MVRSIVVMMALVAPLSLTAQRPNSTAPGPVPRTPWGQPDLQGVWDFSSNTPLQRPVELGDKAEFTEAEHAQYLQKIIQDRAKQDALEITGGDPTGNYNRFWTDVPRMSLATSLVVDPRNGRIPAYTPAAHKWYDDLAAARKGISLDEPTPGGFVEDLGPHGFFVRCIVGFNAGPPMLPQSYNQNVQIFQGPEHVAFLHEMNHNTRIVSTDGRPHVSDRIGQYNGDPRGRWEGETLVVETTNFGKNVYDLRPGGAMRPNLGGTFKLVERFTRTGPDTLLYEYTITDPSWFTAPVTLRVPMSKNPNHLYEYACHEGNHGLRNILAGARHREAEAEKRATDKDKPAK